MTDISKDAVERLAKDCDLARKVMSDADNQFKTGQGIFEDAAAVLRAQAARIAELEAERDALIIARDMMGRKWSTARADALREVLELVPMHWTSGDAIRGKILALLHWTSGDAIRGKILALLNREPTP